MRRPSPQTARAGSRSLLVLGAAVVVLTIFVIVASPLLRGPMFEPTIIGGPNWSDLASFADWIGVGTGAFGLAWMVRIYRRDPEAGPSSWRFHEWD